MKYLVLLYLIEPYIKALCPWDVGPEKRAERAHLYQKIIEHRYPDFQIVRIFFSNPEDMAQPDFSHQWSEFLPRDGDIVGSCGVDFQTHCREKKYPAPKDTLSWCPEPIEELVVGGFHRRDCVDKVARYAHEQGIQVQVDEDLTELFFMKHLMRAREIPLDLRESQERMRDFLLEGDDIFLEIARDARKGKPWLFPI